MPDEYSDRLQVIGERLAGIEAFMQSQDRSMEGLLHRLFGNGQKGELADIRDRVSSLERARWTAGGIIIAVSVAAQRAWEFVSNSGHK